MSMELTLFSPTAIKKTGQPLPTLDELEKMRSGNFEHFKVYCEFLRCVVGKKTWNNETCAKKISKVATVSDEAFTLLLLENYWDSWSVIDINEYEGERELNKDKSFKRRKSIHGKWTQGGSGKARYTGWSSQGLERMNTLRAIVIFDREKEEAEEKYLEYRKEVSGNRKKPAEHKRAVKVVHDDFSDLI